MSHFLLVKEMMILVMVVTLTSMMIRLGKRDISFGMDIQMAGSRKLLIKLKFGVFDFCPCLNSQLYTINVITTCT